MARWRVQGSEPKIGVLLCGCLPVVGARARKAGEHCTQRSCRGQKAILQPPETTIRFPRRNSRMISRALLFREITTFCCKLKSLTVENKGVPSGVGSTDSF